MDAPEVISINLVQRLAFLSTTETVPITLMFDEFGEETQVAAEAVTFVCGSGEKWFSCAVESFGGRSQ